jgi:hypothetical protein
MTYARRLIPLVVLCLILLGLGHATSSASKSPVRPDRELGMFLPGAVGSCNFLSYTCTEFTITRCDGDPEEGVSGTLATDIGLVSNPRGMVSFFSGEDATQFWGHGNDSSGTDIIVALRAGGFVTAQVKWSPSWMQAGGGESDQHGPEVMACRPATLIDHLHDIYLGLHIPSGSAGDCGFCLTGNSGGGSQIAYSLVAYGLATSIAGMFPTSGPVHTELRGGCDERNTDYFYENWSNRWNFDASYGWLLGSTDGPCYQRLLNYPWPETWFHDSIENIPDGVYNYPTRVEFIVGGADSPVIKNHACVYLNKLFSAGQAGLRFTVVDSMGHHIQNSPPGLTALENEINHIPNPSVPGAC